MPPKLIAGPSLVHVGERKPGDPKWATDEYIFAPPGTIVAPRKLLEKPTAQNAEKAILAKGRELGMFGKETTIADLMGEGTMKTPPAYAAYKKATGSPSRPVPMKTGGGIRALRSRGTGKPQRGPRYLPKAEDGIATGGDPLSEALLAIQAAASANGVDVNTAANMLNNPAGIGAAPPSAPTAAPGTMDVGVGGGYMNDYLTQILAAAGLTGPQLMNAQLGIMQALGMVDPNAIGITDPAQFRSILAKGEGMPTLAKQQQQFNQTLYGFSQSSPNRGNVPQTSSQ